MKEEMTPMKKGILAILILLASAGMLSGCMGYAPPAPTPTPLPSGVTASPQPTPNPTQQPERLVTKAEAEVLVGNSLEEGKIEQTPADGMTLVFYPSKQGRFLQVTVHQRNDETAPFPGEKFEMLKLGAQDPAAVEGVGDEAFIAPPGLHMMANGYYVAIACGNPSDTKNVEILKKAGQLVAEKLAEVK
jgi:hypothetical protein